MPLFEYKAVAPGGETVQGTMEAASVELVVLKLQQDGNIPLQAREAGSGGFSLSRLRLGRRGMNSREVGQFTQQLAKAAVFPMRWKSSTAHSAGCSSTWCAPARSAEHSM
jgi:type II secretory pathway component PulF